LVNQETVFRDEIIIVLVEDFVAQLGRFPRGLFGFEKQVTVFFEQGDGDFLPTGDAVKLSDC
jgi:hypothetical protein